MTKMIAAITTSVDGYITGPDEDPTRGSAKEGNACAIGSSAARGATRPSTEGTRRRGCRVPEEMTARGGAIVVGRKMYEAAKMGREDRFGMPVFVVTHRPRRSPTPASSPSSATSGRRSIARKQRRGTRTVSIGGGADELTRQGLDAGLVDELHIIVAPVILGGGKHLFEDFTKSFDLENMGVRQSRWATFIEFAVKR